MPSGDSISSYDRSHEMYHARPTLKQLESYKNHKSHIQDTIANIGVSKEEKWSLPKVEPSLFQVPREKVVDIGRAGRFVFRAIVTPAYILTYTMPKWALTEAIPQLFAQMQKGLNQGKYWLELAGKWLANTLSLPFRTFVNRINWTMQAIEQKAYDLMSFLHGGYQAFINGCNRLFLMPAKTMFLNIKARLDAFKTNVIKKFYLRAKNTYSLGEASIKKLAEKVYQKALLPPYQLMMRQIKNGTKHVKVAVNKVLEVSKKVVDKVKIPFQKGKDAADKVQQTVQTQVAQVLQITQVAAIPVINFFITPFNKALEKVKLGLNWGKRKGQGKYKFAKEKIKKITGRISDGAKRVNTFFASCFRQFIAWLFGPFVTWFKKKFPFISKVVASIKRVFSLIKKAFFIFFKQLKYAANLCILYVGSILKKVILYFLRPKDLIMTVLKVARYGSMFLIVLLRSVFITLYVFCYISYLFWRQGMELVREISDNTVSQAPSR